MINKLNKIQTWIFEWLLRLLEKLIRFPYLPKRIIFSSDIFLVVIAFIMTSSILSVFTAEKIFTNVFLGKAILIAAVTGTFFLLFDTHTGFIRFSSFRDIMRIFAAILFSNLILFFVFLLMPHTFDYMFYTKIGFFINSLLAFSMIFFFRMVIRVVFEFAMGNSTKKKNIPLLIYGIDPAHIGLAKMIRANEYLPYNIAGFISPKPISSHRIMNCPIYVMEDLFGNAKLLRQVKAVLIHSDELDRNEKKLLATQFLQHHIELLSAPPIKNWEKDIREIKKINIEDLLGRPPIRIDIKSIGENLKGKTVLITGAAGSIGSEIVRQLSQFDLGLLLLCDIAESPLHQLCLGLDDSPLDVNYIPLIADVRNSRKMARIFEKYKPHYIYHAAAYKHVPLMEQYPSEAVHTNVLGTRTIADLAVTYKAECFVMISTDKAVNPSNVMGASKRIAEIYIQSLSKHMKETGASNIRFITTRFGNVLGSNGSVIPRFASQIKSGGPVTVTHPDIIRYFMTIPEACSLVLEAGNFGKGGEIFVFDMGESVKIKDLAEEMIRLSGLKPYTDINIVFTGLRPGEKLHEELLYDRELVIPTYNEKIMIGNFREYDYEWVGDMLARLINITSTSDEKEIVRAMKEMVPEFISHNSIYEELDKKINNNL